MTRPRRRVLARGNRGNLACHGRSRHAVPDPQLVGEHEYAVSTEHSAIGDGAGVFISSAGGHVFLGDLPHVQGSSTPDRVRHRRGRGTAVSGRQRVFLPDLLLSNPGVDVEALVQCGIVDGDVVERKLIRSACRYTIQADRRWCLARASALDLYSSTMRFSRTLSAENENTPVSPSAKRRLSTTSASAPSQYRPGRSHT